MEISRSEPMATSKRVTNAAPPRHRFSLEVSSSKVTPRVSRPRTVRGKRTDILRSARDFSTEGLAAGTIHRVLFSGDCQAVHTSGACFAVISQVRTVLAKALHAFQHFLVRARRVNIAAQFAAVSHAVRNPAGELFHFANTVGQVGSSNFLVVAGK